MYHLFLAKGTGEERIGKDLLCRLLPDVDGKGAFAISDGRSLRTFVDCHPFCPRRLLVIPMVKSWDGYIISGAFHQAVSLAPLNFDQSEGADYQILCSQKHTQERNGLHRCGW